MDRQRFDSVLRAYAQTSSRRAVLHALGGLGLTGLIPLAGADAKRKKKKKKPCQNGTKQCGKTCIPATACCNGVCGAGQQCCNGTCIGSSECCGGCGADLTCCNGVCLNLVTDASHCGACNTVCPSGSCVHGACTCTTPADCPGSGCLCGNSALSGKACMAATGPGAICSNDNTCPLGSICVSGGLNCSVPCPG